MNDPGDREGRPYISRASSEDVGATLIGEDLKGQGGGQPRPYSTTIGLHSPCRVGAGLAPALLGWLKYALMGATARVAQVHNYYLTFRGCSPEIVVLSLFHLYLKAMACVAVSETS